MTPAGIAALNAAERAFAWLANNPSCELSFQRWEEGPKWQVHRVTGGRNDQEWTLIAEGETPLEAVTRAANRRNNK